MFTPRSLLIALIAVSWCLRPAAGAQADGGRTPAKADPGAARGLAGVGLTAEDVNRAIEKGRKYLWEGPLGGGKEDLGGADDWLASLALVHAGAHKAYPAFDKALRKRLREISIADNVAMLGSYEVGVLSMLVESYGDPEFHWLLHSAARFHVESQGPKGTFDYKAAPDGFEPIAKLLFEIEKGRRSAEEIEAITVTGGQALDVAGAAQALKRITPRATGSDGDNSATQFGLLGLWSGARSGLKIDADVWQRCLDTTLKRQNKDGGWGYEEDNHPESYGSMTCAGICAIALCKHHVGQEFKADPVIARGLDWLDKKWATDANPENPSEYHHYFLYSVERVGRILDTEFIGKHEWYPLLARQLVRSQKPDGSWEESGTDPRRTCSFALLALTRATPSLTIPAPRGGDGTLLAKTSLGPEKRVFFLLDASGSMLANGGNFDRARSAIQSLLEKVPDKTPVSLRVFGQTRSALEEQPVDSALEVPLGNLDREALSAKLSALHARGSSPLGANIAKSAADLKAAKVSSSQPAVLIILSDGVEEADGVGKAASAAEALAEFKGLTLCAVVLDSGRADDAQVMQRVAEAGGGTHWSFDKLADVRTHLVAALKRGPDGYVVLDAKGQKLEGTFDKPLRLKEGKYTFKADFAGKSYQRDLWINTDVTTTATFAPSVSVSP